MKAIAAHAGFLDEQYKDLKAEITAVTRKLPSHENLISIRGIGEIWASVLLFSIVDIGKFRRSGNLAAFFRMTPSVSHSNDSPRVWRITKRGSKIILRWFVHTHCHALQRLSARLAQAH